MKKIILVLTPVLLILSLWNCQVIKDPAAKIMSTSLPNPTIDTTQILSDINRADFSLMVKDLSGKTVRMQDYRGKVIFLNFWATWCMPCVAELPSINKLYLKFKEKNIVFLLISNEDINKVNRYHQKKKYAVPFYINDAESFIPNLYFSPSIPATFIINKKGEIVKASTGAEDWDDEAFVKLLEKML